MPRLSPRPGFRAPAYSKGPAALANALRDGLRSAEIVEAEIGIPSERVHIIAQGGEIPSAQEERLMRSLAEFLEELAALPEDGEWGDLVSRLASGEVADGHDIIDNL